MRRLRVLWHSFVVVPFRVARNARRYRASFAIEDEIARLQSERAHASVYTPERRARLHVLLATRDWSPAFRDAVILRHMAPAFRRHV